MVKRVEVKAAKEKRVRFDQNMTIKFDEYLHKVCKVEFRFGEGTEKTMSYTGMVEAVIREGEQVPHLVLNAHYAGRTQIELDAVESVEEVGEDYFEKPS